jgi:hypothetical protein
MTTDNRKKHDSGNDFILLVIPCAGYLAHPFSENDEFFGRMVQVANTGKHSSSFNRQREVYPTAMESSTHVCYRRSADWESQPDAHLGVPVWAFLRETHLLVNGGGEL